ncbi:hypothetical protein B9N63_00995 [Campylobacter concisus]|uniref:hypothetical protein n=1 Tax=Campylobacter concisus TaxID=199 RepID=UPI000B3D792C|nr:hypothetical protein [Campylobacter concisus]OUT14899.1 hypothetical protein B9N63_00995 [Campylobacter concisus]
MIIQNKPKLIIFLKRAILFFLSLFLIGQYNEHITAVKNLGIYLALFLTMILFVIDTTNTLENIKNNIKNNKTILLLFILLNLYVFGISIFPYDTTQNAFLSAFSEFKRAFVFIFIILLWHNGSYKNSKWLFFAMVIALSLDNLHFFVKGIEEGTLLNLRNAKNQLIQPIDRFYSSFFDNLFIFSLISLFYIKSNFYKFFITIFNIIIGLIFILLTGARGSWLAIVLSLVVILALIFKNEKINLINKKSMIFCLFLLAASACVYYNSTLLQLKVTQGFYTSGRGDILTKRLPLLFSSNRAYIGIGFGGKQYTKFLNDKNVNNDDLGPTGVGADGVKYPHHDEPVFIGQYYHYGVVGTALFVTLVFYMLFESFKRYLLNNKFYIAIFGSILCTYIFRGLFETIYFTHLYVMLGLFIVFCIKTRSDL